MSLEISRAQVEIGERNLLELIEAHARELLGEHRGVADEDDRQSIGPQVFPRDALDVVWRYGIDALAVGLQLVEVETVEDGVEHLQRDGARRLDRQRKAAGQVGLRVRELAVLHPLTLQTARTPRQSAAALRR